MSLRDERVPQKKTTPNPADARPLPPRRKMLSSLAGGTLESSLPWSCSDVWENLVATGRRAGSPSFLGCVDRAARKSALSK